MSAKINIFENIFARSKIFLYHCGLLNLETLCMIGKLKRLSLSQLEEEMTAFDADVLRAVIGGGNGSTINPYTWDEVDAMFEAGTWNGGYVINNGMVNYMSAGVTVTGYSGNSGGYDILANPFVATGGEALANLFGLGSVFTAAQIFDDTRSFINNSISVEMYGYRLFWLGVGVGAGSAAPIVGLFSYFSEQGINYAAQKLSELEMWMRQHLSNPELYFPN